MPIESYNELKAEIKSLTEVTKDDNNYVYTAVRHEKIDITTAQLDNFILEAIKKNDADMIGNLKRLHTTAVNKALDDLLKAAINHPTADSDKHFKELLAYIHDNKALDDLLKAAINHPTPDSEKIMALVKLGAYPHVITEQGKTALMVIDQENEHFKELLAKIHDLHSRAMVEDIIEIHNYDGQNIGYFQIGALIALAIGATVLISLVAKGIIISKGIETVISCGLLLLGAIAGEAIYHIRKNYYQSKFEEALNNEASNHEIAPRIQECIERDLKARYRGLVTKEEQLSFEEQLTRSSTQGQNGNVEIEMTPITL